jgi:hypothetical protein
MNRAIHKKLLSGKRLHFGGDEPEEERLIKAEWLGEAVRKGVRIDVRKAIIRGVLDLQYVTVEEEVSLINCQIEERANLSYSNFKRKLILSDTSFRQGANFDSANLEYDALLQGTQFLAGEATFVDLHVHGVFDAQSVHFGDGVKANFMRAQFDKSVFFHYARFEGEANFVAAQIGSEANFGEARFNSKDKPASFDGAKIAGVAAFQDSIFEGEARFVAAQLGSEANFGGARFNSKDKPASFDGVKIAGVAAFQNSIFEGGARFVDAQIGSQANFTEARFNSKDKPASFDGVKIAGVAFFQNSIFEGGARFVGADFGGQVNFFAAQFNSKDKPANFDKAKIDGNAFFSNSIFEGAANFVDVEFGGQANFIAARFNSKNEPASFYGTKIYGGAFFRAGHHPGLRAAVFKGGADFRDMTIRSSAEFQEAVFEQGISFERTEIGGNAIFHSAHFLEGSKASFQGTKFHQGAFFQGAEFEDAVDFRTAHFHGEARFHGVACAKKADFGASTFTGLAQFSAGEDLPGTVFKDVSFAHARFEHDARFDDVVFQGDTSFREASFVAVYFSASGVAQGQQQFRGGVDLRGCVYERVEVARKSLLSHLVPYDRQPYTHLEKVFRTIGQDREANEVYLGRCRVEHQRLSVIREPVRWFGDLLYGWIANYGVLSWRVIVWPLVLLLVLGTWVFSRPGAVHPTQPAAGDEISVEDALRLTIRLFLPIEVSLATDWEPSDRGYGPLRFSDLGAAFKLAAWILLSLYVAAFKGLFRRGAR